MSTTHESEVPQQSADRIVRGGGLRRPAWVNSRNHQRVYVLADVSGSMAGRKIDELNDSLRDFARELARPENKNAFEIAVIAFNDSAEVVRRPTDAGTVLESLERLAAEGRTNMHAPAVEALNFQKALLEPEPETRYLPPVFMFLSDGVHNTGPNPMEIRSKLDACGTIVTVAYGDDADESTLGALATSPQHFWRIGTSGAELRQFMREVGRTLSVSVRAGVDSRRVLRNPQT